MLAERLLVSPAHPFRAAGLAGQAVHIQPLAAQAAPRLLGLVRVVAAVARTPRQLIALAAQAVHHETSQAAPQAPLAEHSTASLAPTPCALHPALVAAVERQTAQRPKRATAAQGGHPEAAVEVAVLA